MFLWDNKTNTWPKQDDKQEVNEQNCLYTHDRLGGKFKYLDMYTCSRHKGYQLQMVCISIKYIVECLVVYLIVDLCDVRVWVCTHVSWTCIVLCVCIVLV